MSLRTMFYSTQIDKKLMQAAGMVARVRNEVEIHSRLKHPAVLELYNYFEDSNYVYLVVEMCHNGELNRYLKNTQKRLSEKEGEQSISMLCIFVHECSESASVDVLCTHSSDNILSGGGGAALSSLTQHSSQRPQPL